MNINYEFLSNSTFETFQSVFENNEKMDLDFTEDGGSILTLAISNPPDMKDSQKKCEYLISKGSDINIIDDQGDTPLGFSAARGNYGLVKLLLQKGAEPNLIQGDNRNALMDAFHNYNKRKHEFYLRIIHLLLEKGAKTIYQSKEKTISLSQFIETPKHNTLISDLLSQPERLSDECYQILKLFRLQALL